MVTNLIITLGILSFFLIFVTSVPVEAQQSSATVALGPSVTSNSIEASATGGGSYLAFDSSDNLWVNDGSRLLMYPKTNLVTGGVATVVLGEANFTVTPPREESVSATDLFSAEGFAFDSSGNLWVADMGTNRALMFPKASLGIDGAAATVVLGQTDFITPLAGTSATNLDEPEGLAFDSSGNLWVADMGNNRALMFPKANLVTGGSATEVLGQTNFTTASGGISATMLYRPHDLAFDPSGNLWVADGNSRLLMFPKASLGIDGAAATVVLGQTNFTSNSVGESTNNLDDPWGLSFDSSGNLWVADYYNSRVLMYPPSRQVTNGMAIVVLNHTDITYGTSGTLGLPGYLAFDSSGNLWITDAYNRLVLEYVPPFPSSNPSTNLSSNQSYPNQQPSTPTNFTSSNLSNSTSLNLRLFDSSGNPVTCVNVELKDKFTRNFVDEDYPCPSNVATLNYVQKGEEVVATVTSTNGIPYNNASQTFTITSSGINNETMILEEFPHGLVRGHVMLDGTPVRDGRVTSIQQIGGNDVNTINYTDDNGSYTLVVPAGNANITADSLDSSTTEAHKEVYIPADNTISADLSMIPLQEGIVKLNLYTKYLDSPLIGPLPIDWRVGVHFIITLTSRTGISYVTSNNFTIYGLPGDPISICVDGTQANLPKECQSTYLDNNSDATINMTLSEASRINGNAIDGISGNPISNWEADLYSLNSNGSKTWIKTEYNDSSTLGFSLSAAGSYELEVTGYLGSNMDYGQVSFVAHDGQIVNLGNLPLSEQLLFGGTKGNGIVGIPSEATPGSIETFRVQFMNNGLDRANNATLYLDIPSGTTLVPQSTTLNGLQINGIVNASMLQIPLGNLEVNSSGVVTYQVMVGSLNSSAIQDVARISYVDNNVQATEIIGSVNVGIPQVDIEAPSTVTSLSLVTSGRALAGSQVQVFDRSVFLGQTNASDGGYWSLPVNLPNVGSSKIHSLYASITINRSQIIYSNSIPVRYDPSFPILTQICMQQPDGRNICWNPNNGIAQFPYVIDPETAFEFSLLFNNPEYVSNVVVSLPNVGLAFADLGSDGLFHAAIPISSDDLEGPIFVNYTTSTKTSGIDQSMQKSPQLTSFPLETGSTSCRVVANQNIHRSQELTSFVLQTDSTSCPAATQVSQNGINALIHSEGYAGGDTEQCNSHVTKNCSWNAQNRNYYGFYDDSSGYCTVGIGHLIGEHPCTIADRNGQYSNIQTQDDADQLLESNLIPYEQAILDTVDRPLNQQQFDALTSLVYNIGIGHFENDQQLVQDLNDGNFDAVPADMMKHDKSAGQVVPGLVKRRTSEGAMFQSNTCNPQQTSSEPTSGGGEVGEVVPIWDPSGHVYEAVPSNVLKNVKATILIQDASTGGWSVWKAAEYGQQNPQETDSKGSFGWDVPKGNWQVIFEKPGYQQARTQVYGVPPPKTGLEIPIVSTSPPVITAVSAISTNSSSDINVGFSQYMKMSSLQQNILITSHGTNLGGSIRTVNSQIDPHGVPLTRQVQFVPTNPLILGDQYMVHVNKAVENYANHTLSSDFVTTVTATQQPIYSLILNKSSITIGDTNLGLSTTTDPLTTNVSFGWYSPDNKLASVQLVNIADGKAQTSPFYPTIPGLWKLQANFTDGNTVFYSSIEQFTMIKPNQSSVPEFPFALILLAISIAMPISLKHIMRLNESRYEL